MSNEYKEIINSAIHIYLHGETELEFKVKDYINEVYQKEKSFDKIIEISESEDNYMDFAERVDEVIRAYKEDSE